MSCRTRWSRFNPLLILLVSLMAAMGRITNACTPKCNQGRFVVGDMVRFESPRFRFALEAWSKPELLLAMSSLCKGKPEALLLCNGFKDAEYISLALLARKLALKTVIVLGQEEELDLVTDLSRKLDVRPLIGVLPKLITWHSADFGSTSGDKGKFGLTTTQILGVVTKLEHARMLDCLQLLYIHIGSQISPTSLLLDGVREGAQIYCELVRLGANLQVIDIGGRLGIDYDRSKTGDSDSSVAYGLEEYAAAVVNEVRRICDEKSVNHPVLYSEIGRVIVSHHSILIFKAISSGASSAPAMDWLALPEDVRSDYLNLPNAVISGEHETCLFCVAQLKQRCLERFKEGSLCIEQLATVDGICDLVAKAIGTSDPVRTYNVNLSAFTSITDFWGIGQPCDSDGKIDEFNGSSIKGSTVRKTVASFLRVCWNGIKGSLIIPFNPVTKVINIFTGSGLQASKQELPHESDDANNDRGSGSYGSIADESIPKRGKLTQSKSDDSEGSLLSTIITLHHSPTPNQTETSGTKRQRMEAPITINRGAADMKTAGLSPQNLVKLVSKHTIVEIHGWGSGSESRSDMVPPSSLPPAEVQAWGSASCISLPKPAQPVAFGHMNTASSSGHNFSSLRSGNLAGNFHQMGLPASASSWPKVEQPWGSDFTGNQNAAPTPAAQNQNPFSGQVPVNPEIGVGALPRNQNATPRPVDQNQEPGYPRVGIGCVSINQSFTIHSAGSGTISFNNGNTHNVSAPPCWASYDNRNHNPI